MEKNEYSKVRLENINNGAAQELFDEELRKVVRNINDLNVDAEFPREITMKFKIKPTKDRSGAVTTVSVATRLAPLTKHEGTILLAFRENNHEAFVSNMRQLELDFNNKKSEDK